MNDNVKMIKESVTIREIVTACENINRKPVEVGFFNHYNSIIDYISDCIRSLHSQFDNFIDIQLIGIEEIEVAVYLISPYTLLELFYPKNLIPTPSLHYNPIGQVPVAPVPSSFGA